MHPLITGLTYNTSTHPPHFLSFELAPTRRENVTSLLAYLVFVLQRFFFLAGTP